MGVPNGVVSKQCYEMVLINLYELSGEGRGGGDGWEDVAKGGRDRKSDNNDKKKKKKNVVNERKGNEFKTSSNPILTCKLED